MQSTCVILLHKRNKKMGHNLSEQSKKTIFNVFLCVCKTIYDETTFILQTEKNIFSF